MTNTFTWKTLCCAHMEDGCFILTKTFYIFCKWLIELMQLIIWYTDFQTFGRYFQPHFIVSIGNYFRFMWVDQYSHVYVFLLKLIQSHNSFFEISWDMYSISWCFTSYKTLIFRILSFKDEIYKLIRKPF